MEADSRGAQLSGEPLDDDRVQRPGEHRDEHDELTSSELKSEEGGGVATREQHEHAQARHERAQRLSPREPLADEQAGEQGGEQRTRRVDERGVGGRGPGQRHEEAGLVAGDAQGACQRQPAELVTVRTPERLTLPAEKERQGDGGEDEAQQRRGERAELGDDSLAGEKAAGEGERAGDGDEDGREASIAGRRHPLMLSIELRSRTVDADPVEVAAMTRRPHAAAGRPLGVAGGQHEPALVHRESEVRASCALLAG